MPYAIARICNAASGSARPIECSKTGATRHWVTAKSLDGLFLMIGEEERKIRRDPVGSGSAILKKVFGG